MRIKKIRGVRNIEGTSNSKIDHFLTKFSFSQLKNFRNLLIFQFGKFEKFPIRNISKIVNLENSETLKIVNFKIPKIINFKNSKSSQFIRIKKFTISKNFKQLAICKIRKFLNFEDFKNF